MPGRDKSTKPSPSIRQSRAYITILAQWEDLGANAVQYNELDLRKPDCFLLPSEILESLIFKNVFTAEMHVNSFSPWLRMLPDNRSSCYNIWVSLAAQIKPDLANALLSPSLTLINPCRVSVR